MNETLFQFVAIEDKAATIAGHGIGIFQTFCHYNSDLKQSIINWLNKREDARDMCASYQFQWWLKLLLGISITLFVQVMNFVIK